MQSFQDVISSGSSVLETAVLLRDHGLVVTDVVVFLDRQQGGRENLENNGIRVHAVTNVETMMAVLTSAGCVSQAESKTVLDFVRSVKIEVGTFVSTQVLFICSTEFICGCQENIRLKCGRKIREIL